MAVSNFTQPLNDSSICPVGYVYYKDEKRCVLEEDYLNEIEEYVFPNPYEWFLIGLYVIVFAIGITGNFLVCLAVKRNRHLQTVTNYFIVNLAIADFMVIFICLPPTLIWDIWETWFFGYVLCKIIPYFQRVSVSVSVFTLSAISVERWYAICHPLKFKATATRAKIIIVSIWAVSLLLDIPELVVFGTRPVVPVHITTLLTQCLPSWDTQVDYGWNAFLIVVLYVCPFILMSFTYTQIARCLWASHLNMTGGGTDYTTHENGGRPLSSQVESQVHTRRKAAKMLIVVVVLFGLCYLPVHLLNVLRYLGVLTVLGNHPGLVACILLTHWLCYFNSAINPIIYNFMSAKFRSEFRAAMLFCCQKKPTTASNSFMATTYRFQGNHRHATQTEHTEQMLMTSVRKNSDSI